MIVAKRRPSPDEIRGVLLERQTALRRIREMTTYEEGQPLRDAAGEFGFDEGDLGSEMFEREKAMSIREGVEERLADIERALKRLDDGTYGVCEACGEPIPAERLAARPEARFCLKHQAEQAAS